MPKCLKMWGDLGLNKFCRTDAAPGFNWVIKRFLFYALIFLAFGVADSYPPPCKIPQLH